MAEQMFTMDRRTRWSDSEIRSMLNIIYEMNVVRLLDAKRQRNKEIFKHIEKGMEELGFKKNWDQIRAKWKLLKATYLYQKRNSNSEDVVVGEQCKYFEQMDQLLRAGSQETSDFNASEILEVVLDNIDETQNNISSPKEAAQPSPSCSSISSNSNCDVNVKQNATAASSKPASHTQTEKKNNCDSVKKEVSNDRKRKRSSPYEMALMKFHANQAKLYSQLQREENEWMERQLEKMRKHDERMIQVQTEQMKEIMRTFGEILHPILNVFTMLSILNFCITKQLSYNQRKKWNVSLSPVLDLDSLEFELEFIEFIITLSGA